MKKYRLNRAVSFTHLQIWHYSTHNKNLEWRLRKNIEKKVEKSRSMRWKIQVACYQQHHGYFRHAACTPGALTQQCEYTSTKAPLRLRTDDCLHFFFNGAKTHCVKIIWGEAGCKWACIVFGRQGERLSGRDVHCTSSPPILWCSVSSPAVLALSQSLSQA